MSLPIPIYREKFGDSLGFPVYPKLISYLESGGIHRPLPALTQMLLSYFLCSPVIQSHCDLSEALAALEQLVVRGFKKLENGLLTRSRFGSGLTNRDREMVFDGAKSFHIILINQNANATFLKLRLQCFDYEIGFLSRFTIAEKLIINEFPARNLKDFIKSPGDNLLYSGGLLKRDNLKNSKGEPVGGFGQDFSAQSFKKE